jgi:hypothetical protein
MIYIIQQRDEEFTLINISIQQSFASVLEYCRNYFPRMKDVEMLRVETWKGAHRINQQWISRKDITELDKSTTKN